MNEFNFTQWISIVGPLGGLMFAMYGFLYHAIDRNNERWLNTQGKILDLDKKILDLDKKIFVILNKLDLMHSNKGA